MWKSVVLNGPVKKPQLLQLIAILAAAPIKKILFKVDADLALSCLLATLGRERGRGVVSAFPFSEVGTCFCVGDSDFFPNYGLWKFNGGWI